MPKLLFFDIDGTLFDDQRRLPPSVLPALRRAREKGCLLFLNSGRTLCNMDPRLDALPLDGRILGCGTRVLFHGETLKSLEFSLPDTARLRREVLALHVPLVWECDTALYFDPLGEPHPAIAGFRSFSEAAGIARDIRPEDPDFRAVKMFAFGSRDLVQSLLDRLSAVGLPFQAIDRRGGHWELVPAGCSKAAGIDLLREKLGVPLSDCYAFGDSENDLPMLTHVPNSVAMGNAPESVRRLCAFVAPRPEDDGIARALVDLGLIVPAPDPVSVPAVRKESP